MKMINLSMPLALVSVIAVCFCAGCSDSPKLTGTAEETNEFAFVVSSSDEGAYSSSDELLSSSSEISSSSERSSSSSSSSKGDMVSSSSRLDDGGEVSSAAESSSSMLSESSSSSLKQESSSSFEESSSSAAPPQGGKLSSSSRENPNSLEYYIEELGLNINQVYEGAMATKLTEEKDSDTAPGQAMATEFDGPWCLRMFPRIRWLSWILLQGNARIPPKTRLSDSFSSIAASFSLVLKLNMSK